MSDDNRIVGEVKCELESLLNKSNELIEDDFTFSNEEELFSLLGGYGFYRVESLGAMPHNYEFQKRKDDYLLHLTVENRAFDNDGTLNKNPNHSGRYASHFVYLKQVGW